MVHEVIMVSGYFLVTRREFNLTWTIWLDERAAAKERAARGGIKAKAQAT